MDKKYNFDEGYEQGYTEGVESVFNNLIQEARQYLTEDLKQILKDVETWRSVAQEYKGKIALLEKEVAELKKENKLLKEGDAQVIKQDCIYRLSCEHRTVCNNPKYSLYDYVDANLPDGTKRNFRADFLFGTKTINEFYAKKLSIKVLTIQLEGKQYLATQENDTIKLCDEVYSERNYHFSSIEKAKAYFEKNYAWKPNTIWSDKLTQENC